jgi:hypothetical protein
MSGSQKTRYFSETSLDDIMLWITCNIEDAVNLILSLSIQYKYILNWAKIKILKSRKNYM